MLETQSRLDTQAEGRFGKAAEGGRQDQGLDRTNQLLTTYFRCPPNRVPFLVPTASAGDTGYFRFGSDTICYGQLSAGYVNRAATGQLFDALDKVRFEDQNIELPFDPAILVDNLQRERYSAHFRQEGRTLNDFLRAAYYLMRPLLGPAARLQIQQLRRWRWRQIPFPAWPVDTTVERLHRRLLSLSLKVQGLERIPFIWFWPDGCSSCAVMTHDVERASGRDFCNKLMDLDESFGLRSSFQIVPEKRYSVAESFLENIRNRGFEVNVHDLKHDGRLYADHAEFLRRAKRINSYIREYSARGFRSGILYRNADWYDAFDFCYDMSIPNVAHLDPQLGGCCTVMPYFIGNIVELPVTCTQDYTLFRILGDYSLDLWNQQMALIRSQHGLINFIVHPDYVMEQRAQDTYKALLGQLRQLKTEGRIWMPLPRDVAAWWRARSKMKLVVERDGYRVEGPESERARVAYACVAGDGVTYSLAG